ncbi:MAG: hypothetical protein P1S46_06520 [bacterium]|nr:hypothetical protein [bacterium]
MISTGFFERLYLGNSLANWAASLGTAVIIYLLIALLLKVAGSRLERFSKSTRNSFDDRVADLLKVRTRRVLMAGLSLYGGSTVLVLPVTIG